MSDLNTVFIIYRPENITGGGPNDTIRGIFASKTEAEVNAQSMASLETFNEWLAFPTTYKFLYDKGIHAVYGLRELLIAEVPFSQQVWGELSDFNLNIEFIAKCDEPTIQNHPLSAKYKKEYDSYVKRHKVNLDKYTKVETRIKGE